MSEASDTQRIHEGPLAGAEKRLLRAIARRLPMFFTPDVLTGLGLVGALVVFIGYVSAAEHPAFLWLANLGLLIHWFGDSLDGTVARIRGIERPNYGFFVDQGIDVIGNLLIVTGIGLSPFSRLDTALLAVCGFHMINIMTLLKMQVLRRHEITVGGIGATELRIILFVMNCAIMAFGAAPGFLGFEALTWVDGLMLFGFLAMTVIFLVMYVIYARELDIADRSK